MLKSRWLRGISLALILALLASVYVLWVRHDMTDFGVCYKAGGRILAGRMLYIASDGHLQFKYFPPAALFFAPLSRLPLGTAKPIWYGLSLAMFFLILSLSYDLLPVKRQARAVVMVLAVLSLAKFIGREIELGQVNFLIILALTLAIKYALQGKDIPAGLWWGFSIFFKPYALALLPYFLLKKKFKLAASGLVLFALGLVAALPFYGWPGYQAVLQEWAATLSRSTPVLFTVQANASIYSLFLKVLPAGSEHLARGLLIISCLILGGLVLWLMVAGRRKGLPYPEVLEISFIFILIPMLSPLGWYYNYLYALLATFVLINDIGRMPVWMRWAVALNFFLICVIPMGALSKTFFRIYMAYSLAVVNFLIVMFCLLYLRARSVT
jgi:hypothetical protein